MKTKPLNSVNPDDAPRSLQHADVLERRKAMLQTAHIAPLTKYVEQMRSRPDVEVPYFGPLDGGVNAEILFLLEKPGPRAAATFPGAKGGSGFISRNNNDPTANATWNFMNQINLPRERTVTWNVVPRWNGTMKITAAELQEGVDCVREVVELLPNLKAIVLVGRKAQRAEKNLKELNLDIKIFTSTHPSPIVAGTIPDKWRAIPSQWAEAKAYIDAAQEVK